MTNLSDVSMQLWIDQPKSMVINDGYFRTLRDMSVKSASIMIDPATKAWDPQWSPKDIERLLSIADRFGVEIVLTTWPFPDKALLDKMAHDMMILVNGIGIIGGWEVDVEFNWKTKYINGFSAAVINGVRRSAIDLAGDYLVKIMQEVTTNNYQVAPGTVRMELTSFAEHVENGRAADVAPHMDLLKVQAYSIRKRNLPDGTPWLVPWDHTYGPGHMQKFTFDKTMMIPKIPGRAGLPKIGYGMPLWFQQWPGHTPFEAMNKALNVALKYDIVCMCGWSSKQIFNTTNTYAKPWMDSLFVEEAA